MEIIRHDPWSGCVRVAAYNGMAFFTGHVAANEPPTIGEQTRQILERYTEMIARFGYRREHLLAANGYISEMEGAEQFHEAMHAWCAPGCTPAISLIGASPSRTFKVELALFFACAQDETAGENKQVKEEIVMHRGEENGGYAEVVFHNGFAYFSGVYADEAIKGMRAETEDILRKYEALFAKYGLQKQDIINSNCYVTDMDQVDEYGDPWCAWAGDTQAPAGICVRAGLENDRTVMIQLVAAAKDRRGGACDGR